MYSSYRSSLGLSANASLPSITPAPTNSPRCDDVVGDYLASGYSSEDGCWASEASECVVSGTSVQLFYWDTVTAPGVRNNSGPVTAIYGNLTFTSPSVYISVAAVAQTEIFYDVEICGDEAVGGQALQTMEPLYNLLVSLPPEDLSTAAHSLPGRQASDVAHDLAFGASDYKSLVLSLSSGLNFTYLSLIHI